MISPESNSDTIASPSADPSPTNTLVTVLAQSFVRAELETSKATDSLSTWVLAVIGATLTFFVGNLSDLVTVVGVSTTKPAFALLLIAGMCGLAEKYVYTQIERSLQSYDKFIHLLGTPGAGNPLTRIDLQAQELDVAAAEKLAIAQITKVFPHLAKRVSSLGENPHATHEKAASRLRRQKLWLVLEISAYVIAVSTLVLSVSVVAQ